MIEFNKTIKLKKGSIEISRKNNQMHIEYKDCSKNAVTTNAIIEAMLPWIKATFNYNKSVKFGTVKDTIDDINYSFNINKMLISLKRDSCSHNSPLVEKLTEKLRCVEGSLHQAISHSSFSYAEKLILGEIEDVGFGYVNTSDLSKYYNPKTFSLSPKLDEFVKEVNSFNYKKYGQSIEITEIFNKKVTDFKAKIAEYEKVVKQYGEELVNWGPHMFTKRGVNDGKVRNWVDKYVEVLKTKGITPTLKSNSVQKSRDNANKTQDDYLRLFKSGTQDEAKKMIELLDLESLKTIMTKPTKSIEDKARSSSVKIAKHFCSLDNGKDFKTVFDFVKAHRGNTLPVQYLFKAVGNKENIMYCLKNARDFLETIDPLDSDHVYESNDYVSDDDLEDETIPF